jgi:hypothetical protein
VNGESRARLIFAGVLGAGLVIAVLVVVIAGGGGDDGPPADGACISAWNDDPAAVSLGVHQFNGHGYDLVQVTRLDKSGAPDDAGDCAVVFAASALDPELAAAAQVERDGAWHALSAEPGISPERLGELQGDATGKVNATLGDDGTLSSD